MRYDHDDGCPTPDEFEEYRVIGRRYLLIIAMIIGACLLAAGLGFLEAKAAVTTATHRSYALRPCSTCREVSYPTEAECTAAANAEAQRVGATREIGGAVYTCIIRHNIIATFRPNTSGRAILSWQHDGARLEGFRIVYGTDPQAMSSAVDIPNAASRSHPLQGLSPATYHFAVIAYGGGNDSLPSNVVSKVVM